MVKTPWFQGQKATELDPGDRPWGRDRGFTARRWMHAGAPGRWGMVWSLKSVNEWEIIWETHEIYVVFIWCLYMFTWCLYGVYGVYMVFIYVYMVFIWYLYGVYICLHGVYMVFIWCLYGVYICLHGVFIWCSYDVYMVYIWFIYIYIYIYIYINMIYKCVIIPCIKLYNGESNGTHGFHWLMNDIMGI